MIKLSGISKSFGAQVLFEDLNFSVNRRERIGLVGRNGHGKTTLFRIILGELEADAGKIMTPRRYSIGYVDQHLEFSADPASVALLLDSVLVRLQPLQAFAGYR